MFGGVAIAAIFTIYIPKFNPNPRILLVGGFLSGIMTIILLGLAGYGTSIIIFDEPVGFLYSLPFALFDVVIIYSLFGMIIWPYVLPTWEKMKHNRDDHNF